MSFCAEHLSTYAPIVTIPGPVSLHGGGVMTGPTRVYLIFYGPGWTTDQRGYIDDFVSHLTGSPWLGIMNSYPGATTDILHDPTTDSISVVPGDAAWKGWKLNETFFNGTIESVIGAAIGSGSFPSLTNAIYFLLGDGNVTQVSDSTGTEGTFGADNCGWHTSTNGVISGTQLIRFAFSAYATANNVPSLIDGSVPCQQGDPTSDDALNGIVNDLAHELAESITDPDTPPTFAQAGWYGSGHDARDSRQVRDDHV